MLVSCWLLAVGCWQGCSSDPAPEELAAKAALSYYNRLLEGYPDGLTAAKAGADDLPSDYRAQLGKVYEQYVRDINLKHGGLRAVAVSDNVGRRDSVSGVVYAFLMLSFADSTQEEIVVPMVERNGAWYLR